MTVMFLNVQHREQCFEVESGLLGEVADLKFFKTVVDVCIILK